MKGIYLFLLAMFALLPNVSCVSATGLAQDGEPLFYLVKTRDGVTYSTEWSSDGSRVILVEKGSEPKPEDPKPEDPKPEDPKPEDQNPTAGVDSFGITQLYPTDTKATPTWEIGIGDWEDRLDDRANIKTTKDGPGIEMSGKERINVKAHESSGDGSKGKDHGDAIERGYMDRPDDWKNFEATVKLTDADFADDDFTMYGRGGRHTSSNDCRGFAYKGSVDNDGKVRFAKEQLHVDYDYYDRKSSGFKIKGQTTYHKFVVYNQGEGNKAPVVVEWWISADGKTFKKVQEAVDNNDWDGGESGSVCGRPRKAAMTGGGPLFTFRTDKGEGLLTKASVRSIVPPKTRYKIGDTVTVK